MYLQAHAVMQSMKCVITASMEEGKRADTFNNSPAQHCCPLCPMEQFAALCSDLEGNYFFFIASFDRLIRRG